MNVTWNALASPLYAVTSVAEYDADIILHSETHLRVVFNFEIFLKQLFEIVNSAVVVLALSL